MLKNTPRTLFTLISLLYAQAVISAADVMPMIEEKDFSGNNPNKNALMTLKPGEKVTIITRKVTYIKVPITSSPSPYTFTWRCKYIPEKAFKNLGTYGRKSKTLKSAWEKKAVAFILKYASYCPSYSAMEKTFPPWLEEKKYTDMLSVIYQLETPLFQGSCRI